MKRGTFLFVRRVYVQSLQLEEVERGRLIALRSHVHHVYPLLVDDFYRRSKRDKDPYQLCVSMKRCKMHGSETLFSLTVCVDPFLQNILSFKLLFLIDIFFVLSEHLTSLSESVTKSHNF